MANFATIALESIRSKERVEQLVVDGIPQLDLFEHQLVGTGYGGEFRTLLRYFKNTQDADINQFRSLKAKYLESVQKKKK